MGRLTIFLMGQLTMAPRQFFPVTFIEIPVKSQRDPFWNLRECWSLAKCVYENKERKGQAESKEWVLLTFLELKNLTNLVYKQSLKGVQWYLSFTADAYLPLDNWVKGVSNTLHANEFNLSTKHWAQNPIRILKQLFLLRNNTKS